MSKIARLETARERDERLWLELRARVLRAQRLGTAEARAAVWASHARLHRALEPRR